MHLERNLRDIPSSTGNILVIDDDKSSLFLVQDLLSSMGLADKVTAVSSAQEAFDVLLRQLGTAQFPAYIILDIMMPNVNGFGFLDKLDNFPLAFHQKPKIILLSYYGNRAYQEQAAMYGVSAYLRKPLTKEKVLEVIHP